MGSKILKEAPTLDIIHHSNGLIAVNKPAGLPVHGSRILADDPDTVLSRLRNQLGRVVHVAHRLDRPVSGILLCTEDKALLAPLGHAFEERAVRKCYLGVVRGWTDAAGEIAYDMLPPREDRKPASVAKPSLTRYRTIAHAELPHAVAPYDSSRFSLVELEPLTGRRHQLRRHMKRISHPLIGDTSYGRGEYNRLFREKLGCRRLLLHAWMLELEHPASRETLHWQAPLDAEFRSVIEQLRWTAALEKWQAVRERR